MNLWIAFFRGINVGGRNIIPMQELKDLLAGIGCRDVCSYIQSGNLVFRHDEEKANTLTAKIANLAAQKFGFEPEIVLLELNELHAALLSNPFPEAAEEPKSLHIYFLSEVPVSADLDRIQEDLSASEAFCLQDKLFYLFAPDGVGRSKLAPRVERYLKVSATARNLRTVSKVLALANKLAETAS